MATGYTITASVIIEYCRWDDGVLCIVMVTIWCMLCIGGYFIFSATFY